MPVKPLAITDSSDRPASAFGDKAVARATGDQPDGSISNLDTLDHLMHDIAELASLSSLWVGRPGFTIVDTHFDAGQNLLAIWSAWRNDPQASARLHYVGFAPDAMNTESLAARWKPFIDTLLVDAPGEQNRQHLERLHGLIDAWPKIGVDGVRSLELDGGKVRLTLVVGEVLALTRNMRLRGDAFLINGDALSSSLDSKIAQLCKALARMAPVGAPLVVMHVPLLGCEQNGGHIDEATVRHALETAGFRVRTTDATAHEATVSPLRQPSAVSGAVAGSGTGAINLVAYFEPRWRVRRHPPPSAFTEVVNPSDKTAIVIGAGIAGCHVVERLAAHGWRVTLIDKASHPASGASGNPAGVFHPMITADNGLAARLSRSGFLHALSRWQALEKAGHALRWSATGLVQTSLESDLDGENTHSGVSQIAQPPGLPTSIVAEVNALATRDLVGVANAVYPASSWLFKQGGWIDPVSLCHALLAASQPQLSQHFGQTVEQLDRRDAQWHAIDRDGHEIAAASIVIVANAYDAQRLTGLRHINMDNIRGQLTFLPEALLPGLKHPMIGGGYLTPSPQGPITGASYGVGDTRTEIDQADHVDNISRLASLLGFPAVGQGTILHQVSGAGLDNHVSGPLSGLDARTLAGRVAFRCTTLDRLPMIGMVGDEHETAMRARSLTGAHPLDLPRQEGLYAACAYGSRGLIWSALAAELLLSQIERTPPPLETDLIDAIDPARFLLRDVRRGKVR